MTKYKYFNRDISWLSFNHRVLEEAKDKSVPLYERLNFLAIYSNNLEEFYRVRVSYYKNLLREASAIPEKIREVRPAEIIQQINKIVSRHQIEFTEIFENLIPELKAHNIILVKRDEEITESQRKYIRNVFFNEILSSVQPVLLVKKKIKPFLKTGHVYLVLKMYSGGKLASIKNKIPKYGLIKLPTDHNVSRFIELPQHDGKFFIFFLEDVIMRNIEVLFPGYTIKDWYSIKLTRDADLEYDDYEGKDLIDVIEKIERTRDLGLPNRFQYDRRMPDQVLRFLDDTFDLTTDSLVEGRSIHNFRDFFNFPNPITPELENEKLPPLRVPMLDGPDPLMDRFDQNEYILHFPFQSYNYFINFLNEAAQDHNVTQIRATQYRVASNSAVVDALINAALNGKDVRVFVELKARFDEEANLRYAREMRQAGIKIIYSIPGLKVHSKMALINKGDRKYAFLGTGNFNEKTARLYGDHGFFTTDDNITTEVSALFDFLENQETKVKFNHLLVPNFNMVETYKKLIDQEIENVKKGQKGYILLKMNGLQDPIMVDKLYDASNAGVKIDLLIRGVCILIPDMPYSKNIRIIRIIDRFLEHARVFVFHNNGENIIYMGSGDWMKRNLYRRIECVFPIYNNTLKEEVLDILNIQLRDTEKGRIVDSNLNNLQRLDVNNGCRSQIETYNYLRRKYLGDSLES